jgi:hypothetical protein
MSASGWGSPDWRARDGEREGLPEIEDLPIAERGYDQEAVQEAFDRFYRHAAQLDSTLRVLESVEAFSTQARELRADIRSLRAASWGPAPSARHVWSVGHETWAPEEPPAALAASLPRLALWAVLIVAVGVGAALADLDTLVIVALVLGAWVLVGVIELVLASSRAARVHAPLSPPQAAPAAEPEAAVASRPQVAPAAEPEAAVASPPPAAPAVVAPQETMISAPVAAAAVEEDVELEPSEVAPAPVVEAPVVVEEQKPEAVVATDEAEPEPEPEAEAEAVPPAAALEPVPAAPEEDARPRRGLFRRRREPEVGEDTDPQLGVPEVAAVGWRPEEQHVDPWEQQDAEANGEPDEPLEAVAPPTRGLLRRGRR